MDYRVGAAIFNKPWLIEEQAAKNLLVVWDMIASGQMQWNAHSDSERAGVEKLQSLVASNDVAFAPATTWDAKYFDGFGEASTAVITLSGVLMKGDFCGSLGTSSIARLVALADSTPSVKSIVFAIDSPGGTVDGTESLSAVIRNASKKTIAFVDGMAASAAYWVASSCTTVIASARTASVGSIGTMFFMRDFSKMEAERGVVVHEYYATASVDKNRTVREAKAGNPKLLIAEELDPLNDEFMGAVKRHRAGKIDLSVENVLTGKMYFAPKALSVGLIDEIGDFNTAIKRSQEFSNNATTPFNNMAFEKTLAAAKAAQFAVVDGGFLLEEGDLNNVEAAISASQETIAARDISITELTAQVATLTEKEKELTAAAQASAATIVSLNGKITALQSGAPEFKQTVKEKDEAPIPAATEDSFETSVDRELAQMRAAINPK